MINATMQDFPLTVTAILRHGSRIYRDSECVTWTGTGAQRASFAQIADDAERLAAALRRLGVRDGERVGTFAWNNQEHLAAYFAVPCMGAVLHTLNLRLPPDQLTHIVNHAEDKIIILNDNLVPLMARVAGSLGTVEAFIVVGDGDAAPLEQAGGARVLRYHELLAAEEPGYPWPELDERTAASMCYTSGTTGDPKGVVYSHRSTFLHAQAMLTANIVGISETDRVLPIVPMFHVNAWGLPYSAFLSGAALHMPGPFLQPEHLTRFIAAERTTVGFAVPTIWNAILNYGADQDINLSSLRVGISGGAAAPRALLERLEEQYGVRIIQGWGMTETSPLGGMAFPPPGVKPGSAEDLDWRLKSGRIAPGVQMRIIDDLGAELPWDGVSVGEIEVRGPWITGSYHQNEAPEKFHDGWLRTGDIGTIDQKGFFQITDRAKDVIKSGGEWISSVELENHLVAHPGVLEAAVIGIPDARWDERPLACVVRRPEATVSAAELAAFLVDKVAKWQIPENWTFIDEIPKTTVGKYDKKPLRARFHGGELTVERL